MQVPPNIMLAASPDVRMTQLSKHRTLWAHYHLCRGCWAAWRQTAGTGQMPWQLGVLTRFSAPQGTLKDTWPQAQAIGTVRGQGRQGPACKGLAHHPYLEVAWSMGHTVQHCEPGSMPEASACRQHCLAVHAAEHS